MAFVQLGESRSCVRDIRMDCIEGSVLGPMLSNIYISDPKKVVSRLRVVCNADDAYAIASESYVDNMNEALRGALQNHFNWLESVGMVCNMRRTELITFGCGETTIETNGTIITSKDHIKASWGIIDKKLNWNIEIGKITAKCRSFEFSIRYIRRYLNTKICSRVIQRQIILCLTYGSPVWSHNLSYINRGKLRSTYFHLIRVVLRDFNYKLNQSRLLLVSGLESIDILLLKRTSVFIFNIIFSLLPYNLCLELFSRSNFNERTPGRLNFFDTCVSKIDKSNILNHAKNIAI